MMRRLVVALAGILALTVVAQPPPNGNAGARSSVEDQLARAAAAWRTRPVAAIEAAEAAARRAEAMGRPLRQAEALRLLGRALDQSGSRAESVPHVEKALALETAHGDAEGQLATTLLAARLVHRAGDYARSAALRDDARNAFAERGDALGLARVDALESLIAVRHSDFAAAIDLGRPALDRLLGRGDELEFVVMASSALAYALHQTGRWTEAEAVYEEVVAAAWALNDQASLNFAFCNRAEVAWLKGDPKPAFEDLERAIEGLEQHRAQLHTAPWHQADFLAQQAPAYDRLIRYLADTYRGEEAFDIAERYHARALLERLAPAGEAPSPVSDAWDGAAAAALSTTIDAIGRTRLALEEADEPRTQASLRQRLAALEADRRQHEARRARAATGRRAAPTIDPPDLATVQAGLEPDEVMVAYWLSDERLFAWALSRTHVDFVHVPVRRQQIVAAVQAFLEPMRDATRAQEAALRGAEDEHLALAATLYRWLIAPLPEAIRRAERLIIVPDGVLHYLPFEALVADASTTDDARAGGPHHAVIHQTYRHQRFLGLDLAIVYSPSAATYLALRDRDRVRPDGDGATLLALAPSFTAEGVQATAAATVGTLRGPALGPLPFSRQEVERIGALFPGARTLVGAPASERRLKDEVSSYRFVHLATHGVVRDELPMSSGVLLRPGAVDDGLLQAREVLDLDLRADLVTLSACRTGRGRLQRGEGIVGLSRAFLDAGAASVLVSLWDVDDRSTPILMEAFYRGLARGLDRATALRDARRALFAAEGTTRLVFRERPMAYAHPRFWSSFVLIGTP